MLPTCIGVSRSCIKLSKVNSICKCQFILKSCSRSNEKHPFFLIRTINTNNNNNNTIHKSYSNESFEEEQKAFETARKTRNEQLLKNIRGIHIETYFNKLSNIDISTIWISIQEFKNLRMILKAYEFKDPSYGIIMKHLLNDTLKINLIENYKHKI
eukprot:4921_1